MTNLDQFDSHITNLKNWQPMTKVAEDFPQFTPQQLKRLFWQRNKHPGLSTSALLPKPRWDTGISFRTLPWHGGWLFFRR